MVFLRGCLISRCALILRLLILLAISIDYVLSGNQELINTYLHLRPRLGHFHKVDGYLKIYEHYFSNVIQKLDKKLSNIDTNDWRNVRPTGESCVNYLLGFQVKSYKLNKPYELIVLDSCLGWLYDTSAEKQFDLDKFNSATKEELKMISEDKKLKEIYGSTNFKDDQIPKELKEKIMDYLLKLLKIYADNPRNGCHSLWLESYNDFIEEVYLNDCEVEDEVDKKCVYFGYENSQNDSYLNLIFEATKQASKNCYNVLQRQMSNLLDEATKHDASIYKKFKVSTNKLGKQSDTSTNKLSIEMVKILQLVTGNDQDKPIKLADVSKDLLALKDNDEIEIEKFTEAVSKYAMQKVDMKDTSNDPEGRARFGKAMTKLCKPYIDPKFFLAQTGGSTLWEDADDSTKKPFEFYHLIYSLVRLTNHESIYGISKEKFEQDVIANKWQSLYLVTLACQMISTTWGQLDYETNRGEYKVYLRPNAQVLIEDWPIEFIDNKLQSETNSQSDIEPELEPETMPVLKEQEQSKQESQVKPDQVEQKTPVSPPSISNPTIKSKPKSSDSTTQQQQQQQHQYQQKSRPESGNRFGFKFKNPLKSPKLGDSGQQNKAFDSNFPDRSPPVTPRSPDRGKSSQLSPETLEMFKQLHGRLPKNSPGEKFPEADRKLEGIFPKALENISKGDSRSLPVVSSPKREQKSMKKPTTDTLIPLAFDFDKKFVGSQGKVKTKKVAATDKWANLDAISL